jgi:hypothetical protein
VKTATETAMPRGLTADQAATLHNMREAMLGMLRELFPRSPDKGLTELQIVMAKAEIVFNAVISQADAIFNATVTNQAPVPITNQGMSEFLSTQFLNHFHKWSKDELLLLLVIIHTDRAISERGYRGLPHSEKEMESIIRLPNV